MKAAQNNTRCRTANYLATAILLCITLGGWSGESAQQAPGYDIRHYDLRVEPDFAAGILHLSVTIEISNPGLAHEFSFELGDRYQVASARDGNSEAKVQRDPRRIVVSVPRTGKKVLLNLDLNGKPGQSDDEERPVMDNHSLFLLWSDRWYPADFNDWATVKTTVVLPPNFQAIAPGKLVAANKRENGLEYVFETSRPTVSFSLFADSRWVRTEREVGGFDVVTLLHPESQKHAEQIFATSPDVLKFFSELHGGYLFDQFAFITIPGMYARRAFPGWVGYSPEYLETEMARTGYDAHETSLLWWGLTSQGRGPGSWQWTEGLGDYAEVMYAEARHKLLAANFGIFRQQYLDTPVDQDVPYTRLRASTPQKIVHGKYPWLMQVMRERCGDHGFRRGIRLLFERYRYRTFTMDEFIAAFEQADAQSLGWWREQWLERKGIPVVAFQASWEPAAGGYRITCLLEQRAEFYVLPLEIAIRSAAGVRTERVFLNQVKAEYAFNSPEQPLQITLDPNERILMKKIQLKN
jgi:hypothetical protein